MLAHMDPDFEWRPLEASPVARAYRGREQVRRYVEDWLGTFESLRLDLEDPVQVADPVMAVVRGQGRAQTVAAWTSHYEADLHAVRERVMELRTSGIPEGHIAESLGACLALTPYRNASPSALKPRTPRGGSSDRPRSMSVGLFG
jgi:SnoaL-like protein